MMELNCKSPICSMKEQLQKIILNNYGLSTYNHKNQKLFWSNISARTQRDKKSNRKHKA
jgi:hypothetical protein